MSYDIELINRKTKQPLLLSQPQYIRGETVKAKLDENDNLVQTKETEASINITYNYSHYKRLRRKPQTDKVARG